MGVRVDAVETVGDLDEIGFGGVACCVGMDGVRACGTVPQSLLERLKIVL